MIRDRSNPLPDGLTFGEALIASMEEALAFKRGEIPLRTRRAISSVRETAPRSMESGDRNDAREAKSS